MRSVPLFQLLLAFVPLVIPICVIDEVIESLHGRPVVFVGDSLTRYQYLDLTYYLRHRQFVFKKTMNHHILLEKTWENWHSFMRNTNHLLAPYEMCDCYRNDHYDFNEAYENRYYVDDRLNISISYFSYLGSAFAIKGRWLPGCNNDSLRQPPATFDPPRWEYQHLHDFITNVLSTLRPRTFLLVLNSGLWRDNFDDQDYAMRVAAAAVAVADHVVWKTTNCRRSQVVPETRSRAPLEGDTFMCSFPADTMGCFDLSWTFDNLTREDYWDEGHFMPPVYQQVNVQFLSFLQSTVSGSVSGSAASTRVPATLVPTGPGSDMVGKLVIDQDTSRHYYADGYGFLLEFVNGTDNDCTRAFSTSGRLTLPTEQIAQYVKGPPVGDICREGALLKGSTHKSIFLMDGHARREFQSFSAFAGGGHDLDEVVVLPDRLLRLIRLGSNLY